MFLVIYIFNFFNLIYFSIFFSSDLIFILQLNKRTQRLIFTLRILPLHQQYINHTPKQPKIRAIYGKARTHEITLIESPRAKQPTKQTSNGTLQFSPSEFINILPCFLVKHNLEHLYFITLRLDIFLIIS